VILLLRRFRNISSRATLQRRLVAVGVDVVLDLAAATRAPQGVG
jgi:hypothetical protein